MLGNGIGILVRDRTGQDGLGWVGKNMLFRYTYGLYVFVRDVEAILGLET